MAGYGMTVSAGLTVLAVLAVLAVLTVLASFALSSSEGFDATTTASRASGKVSAMVINGQDNEEDRRYFVQFIKTRSTTPFCGGVLIRPNVVLTAAHCFRHYTGDAADNVQFEVICTIGDDNVSNFMREFSVLQKVIFHPKYLASEDLKSEGYDIALVFLKGPGHYGFGPPETRSDLIGLPMLSMDDWNAFERTRPTGAPSLFLEESKKDYSEVKIYSGVTLVGRGWTNRDIQKYTQSSAEMTEGDGRGLFSIDGGIFPEKTVLIQPQKLQVATADYVLESPGKTQLVSFLSSLGASPMSGDSGGPLMIRVGRKLNAFAANVDIRNNVTYEWHVLGVASFASFDAKGKSEMGTTEATFASVPFFKDWVDATIRQEEFDRSATKLDKLKDYVQKLVRYKSSTCN